MIITICQRKAHLFPLLVNAAIRRHEAASWLRKTVGVVCAKDLPEEPSEEEFQLGLRNGIILCNALNKVQPGAIPKVTLLTLNFLVSLLAVAHAKYLMPIFCQC